MNIVEPSVEVYFDKNPTFIYKDIERAGRVCYKSEPKITENSYEGFIRNLLKRGHEAVIEHESISVKIICDRGVTHELVRHRIGSFCQESTRYVNYQTGINVIQPPIEDIKLLEKWRSTMCYLEDMYKEMIEGGIRPEIARSVLPTCLKTEIMVTFNLREWRHFLKLRLSKAAHPQMRQIAKMILESFMQHIPLFFEDIQETYGTI